MGELVPTTINGRIDAIVGSLHLAAARNEVQILEGELEHHFEPGVYLRVFTMPAGSFCIGHEHTTRHRNVVLTGHAWVIIDGELHEFKAGDHFSSDAGTRKVLFIDEELRWMTVHPMLPEEENEPDVKKRVEQLENRLRVISPLHDKYLVEAEALRLKLMEVAA